ncbi:type VI secretion system tube protein Hcp [Accumulibacter sp.]|uniref:Hcp family type VI secretion system effector n=1 Tax=Accumulibacter sp. TaxID=2053492 RepID=UPI0025FF6603|nr:type VI secretion system tube protein Hcp [Accumulibacter sp.]MCM8612045.1 type VI secretion system tube protein Hcp [Accumulibacter sp.]MCM8636027.1 type VI secretion system tube protein Hcp [Accumulibacter sp.]MCM8639868.1 type VI secretion system tube protein Hcp [Accumulibacter sp.]
MALRDMFLKIDGAKQGPIRGEASDPKHVGEIEVMSWSWGMQSPGDPFAAATARTSFDVLRITKRVDSATTALMSALRFNEMVKKAVLTVRKSAGPEALEYLTITLERARIVQHQVSGGQGSDSAELSEDFALSFQKVMVEYVPQGRTGSGRGTTTFQTEINS